MRVHNGDAAPARPADIGRSQEAQRSGLGGSAGSRPAAGSESGDRVEFSAGLGQLARAVSAYGADRAGRVEALAALYQGGAYQSDPVSTARSMVSEALGAGAKPI